MLKKSDEKGSQTAAAQSRLSRLKQPQVWMPVSILVLMALFLILFKVERQEVERPDSPWTVKARDWTGFGQSYDEDALTVTEEGTETTGTSKKETTKTTTTTKRLQPAKTLWDWMTLLLAPATLAVLGFLFQSSQEKAKRDKEEADKARDADQQREQALQTYFDQLSALLVDKQLKKLLPAKQAPVPTTASIEEGADASTATEAVTARPELSIDAEAALDVVKARTLSLLRLFDDDIPRKASILSFLADADLLKQLELDLSDIRLEGANLKKVNFSACSLEGANLRSADLNSADLSRANLHNATLHNATLHNATLSDAALSDTDFSRATLNGADLHNATLHNATLSDAKLKGANLRNVSLSDVNNRRRFEFNFLMAILSISEFSIPIFIGLAPVSLISAIFRIGILRVTRATFRGANLSGADFSGADFSGANLYTADLNDADLSSTNFRDAKFWDSKLTGATINRAKKDAVERIKSAKNWQEAKYDSEMYELLGLPPETLAAKAND